MNEKRSALPKILLGAAALGAGACVCGGGALAAVFLATRGGDIATIPDPDQYPPPGNPKGSFYVQDAGPPDTGPPDTGPPIAPPGNPKGTLYDLAPPPVAPPTKTP